MNTLALDPKAQIEAASLPPTISLHNDADSVVQMGSGYDSLRLRSMNNIAFSQNSIKTTSNSFSASSDYSIQICDTKDELVQAMSFSLEAEGSYLGATVGAAASMAYSAKMTATTIAVIAQMKITSKVTSLDFNSLEFDATAKGILEGSGANPEIDFYNKYGNYYCGSQTYGGILNVLFLFKTVDLAEKKELSGSLKVNAKKFSTAASFSALMESVSTSTEVDCQILQVGGTPMGINPLNTEEVIDYLADYPDTVDGKTVIINQYNSFSQVAGFTGNLDTSLAQPSANILDLKQNIDSYEEYLTDMEYAVSMESDYDLPANTCTQIGEWVSELTDYTSALQNEYEKTDVLNILPTDQVLPKGYYPPAYFKEQFDALNLEAYAILNYGDTFYLQATDTGNYLLDANSKKYAKYGSVGKHKHTLVNVEDSESTDTPQSEDQVFLQIVSSSLGDYVNLGAFKMKTNLYYWSQDSTASIDKETWVIVKTDPSVDNVIRYGDNVQFITQYYSEDQYMTPDGNYLTTSSEVGTTWTIMRDA